MNRARRTGIAGTQLELKNEHRFVHLSVTVASLEDKVTSGYVLVVEDTSDLLRAQKAAAWHEVARRIAHEIKNPLTPIALCAERIGPPPCARDHAGYSARPAGMLHHHCFRGGIAEDPGG